MEISALLEVFFTISMSENEKKPSLVKKLEEAIDENPSAFDHFLLGDEDDAIQEEEEPQNSTKMQQTQPSATECTKPSFDLSAPELEGLRVHIWDRHVILGNPGHVTMQHPESQVYWDRLTHETMIDEAARVIKSYATTQHGMIRCPLQMSIAYLLGFEIMEGGSWMNIAHQFGLL